MALEIRPLTRGRLADVAALFGQGGDPKWCWCAYFRVRGLDFMHSTAANNRGILEGAIHDDGKDHPAPGLVAYLDGEPVGWTSLGPREDYERLAYSKVLAPIDDRPVWSIVCFVVARQRRGQGIAVALLDAAIAYATEHGATTLEAYPVDASAGRISSASAYHGTLTMFERAGFTIAEIRRANASSAPRPIVRLDLTTAWATG
jgi:GNAT superfamily N-acetyltransferase